MSERPSKQFFRPDVRRDVDDEIAYHLEMRARQLVERGALPDEARESAVQRFGNAASIARECRAIDEAWYREQRRASMWTDLRQDVAYAVRVLARAPGFAAVAIVTLALGIGGSTAIFSVIDAALLRPLPYPHPEQLVEILIEEPRPDGRVSRFGPSMEDIRIWRENGQVFSHVAAWAGSPRPALLDGPEPERVRVTQVSEDYLGLFGVVPVAGRGFQATDMPVDAPSVVILGHEFALRRFGSTEAALGQTMRLDNAATTIVGVLPASFRGGAQVWRPLRMPPESMKGRGSGATTYGRLRPHVSIAQAKDRLVSTSVDRSRGEVITVRSLYDQTTAGSHQTSWILAGAVGTILLIACINVAGLLLARGATRRPELTIRASLGAGRGRLVRQMLVESVVLASAGGLAGVLLAWLALDALVANIPLSLDVRPAVNPSVLGFAAVLSVVTGILFGLAPAVTLSRVSETGDAARGAQRSGSAFSRRGGQWLIGTEVALAIVLLAGAGLMIKSFARILAVDVGFDPDAVITMQVTPVVSGAEALQQYYTDLVPLLRGIPGVDAAGAVDQLPLGGSATKSVARVDGQAYGVDLRHYVSGYFETLGFPLREGRLPADGHGPEAVINEQAARQLFVSGSAIGRQIVVLKRTYNIVAVVGDVRHQGPLFAPDAEVYVPHAGTRPLIAVARTPLRVTVLDQALRQSARAVGPAVVVEDIRRGSDWLDDRILTPRRRTVLLALLGALGFVLALVGVFGMTAYAVARRTREIGIRMALGARPHQVVGAVVADALWPLAIGIAAGVGIATLATRVIASFLFDTPPTDPATFVTVAITMGLCAWLAAWLPARRAARVDPVSALRAT